MCTLATTESTTSLHWLLGKSSCHFQSISVNKPQSQHKLVSGHQIPLGGSQHRYVQSQGVQGVGDGSGRVAVAAQAKS